MPTRPSTLFRLLTARHCVAVVGIATLLLPGALAAVTYVMPTDEELLERSSVVLLGEVVAVEPSVSDGPPSTEYLVEVERVVKGFVPASTVLVRVPGGVSADGHGMQVFGAPMLFEGERSVFFLGSTERGAYPPTDLALGVFSIVTTEGETWAVRWIDGAHELQLEGDPDLETRRLSHRPRRLEAFLDWLERPNGVQKETTARDYFAPPGVRIAPTRGRFNLIRPGQCGPEPLRFPGFESGATLDFRAAPGGQPGAPNGGSDSIRDALRAWNRDGESEIALRYRGLTAGPAHAAADGQNVLVWEDPDDSIDGSFRLSGTLAATSIYFSCGATHRYAAGRAIDVLGFDLITQDGFGQNYLGRVADPESAFGEILAHELGHALGIGHSCESQCSGAADAALMRAFAHNDGRGARLSADDRRAASALYPVVEKSGRPTAPTSLVASALSTSEIQLTWTDTSDDEEFFDIEERTVGGEFSLIQTLPADSTTLVVTGIPEASYRTYRVRSRHTTPSDWSNQAAASTRATVGPCSESATTLCLQDDRFAVTVQFLTDQLDGGPAQANELTPDTGFYTFFDPTNVEVVVKVLDACVGFEHYWVFAAGLTNVQVEMRVVDTQTGETRTYLNDLGEAFQPIQDVTAFPTCP